MRTGTCFIPNTVVFSSLLKQVVQCYLVIPGKTEAIEKIISTDRSGSIFYNVDVSQAITKRIWRRTLANIGRYGGKTKGNYYPVALAGGGM